AGELDDALAEAESGVVVCEQLTARALTPSLHGLLSRVAIHRGDVTAARDHLRRAHAHADLEEGGRGEANSMLWCQAILHEAMGEPQAAVQVLAPLYASLPRRAMLLTLTPSMGPHLVRLARQTGHLAQARA